MGGVFDYSIFSSSDMSRQLDARTSTVIITPTRNSNLSRFAVFDPPLPIGKTPYEPDEYVTSVEMAFWYIVLRQAELVPGYNGPVLSRQMVHNYSLRKNPSCIAHWVNQKGVFLGGTVLLNSGHIYGMVLGFLIAGKTNGFAKAFLSSTNCPFPNYIVCGKDRVFSINRRESKMNDYDAEADGFNVWGRILTELAKKLAAGEYPAANSELEMENLLGSPHKFFKQSPRHAVLIVSDSYARNFNEIVSGYVVRRSGGTFGQLADDIIEQGVDLADYAYIIISCGFNDSMRSQNSWLASWGKLERLLEPEIRRRDSRGDAPSVLFSLELPFPDTLAHRNFMVRKLSELPVAVVDWKNYCPFLKDGQRVPGVFRDTIHLNCTGMHLLWKEWVSHFHKLQCVAYKLSYDKYKDSASCTTTRKPGEPPTKKRRQHH